MTKDLIVLNPAQSLYEAEALFKKHKIRHIPVVESKKLLGILSHSDLLRISFADLTDEEDYVESVVYDMYTIDQVMAKAPITVNVDATVKEVAEVLSQQSFHSLPVVENDELVGIVTTTDLINYMLKQFEE
ncbi:CBS domain-containing protein [Avrilella dinanensis]|uniref:CBS domain-containing protein n=2 Tax=Avrilella dinanensis TaxID=2008672 RepID=A0A2M9R8G7_9FLAO|nr:CBS domain-containing protein [Avrilella dinanensis]